MFSYPIPIKLSPNPSPLETILNDFLTPPLIKPYSDDYIMNFLLLIFSSIFLLDMKSYSNSQF